MLLLLDYDGVQKDTHNSVEDVNIYYKMFTIFLLNHKIPLSSIIFLFVVKF